MEKVEVKPSPYDTHYTFAYLDGHRIAKIIQVYDEQPGQEHYREYNVDSMLSEDGTKLLPKTDRGKPQNFTSANLSIRTPVGMSLNYSHGSVALINETSGRAFYCSVYDDVQIDTFQSFPEWVDNWCRSTDENAQKDFPIHYGKSISIHEQGIRYQCGRTYIAMDDKDELCPGFRNGGIGWNLNVKLSVLRKCISENSNAPYWEMMPSYTVNQDLRNPKFSKLLGQIHKQVGR